MTKINKLNLEISLPNNLTGHASIVTISEQLTSRLEGGADKESDSDEEESSDESDISLQSIFKVGQYLRAYVVSTSDSTASGKGKKKIELSLRPSETNTGLEKDDVVPNSTVMASVVSVEDRGCVMDLGIPALNGFLPNSEIDPLIDHERLQPGAVFLCQVTGKGSAKTVQLSLMQDKLGSTKAFPADATTINTFLPGTLVNILVSENEGRGLGGKIMGAVDATADLIHSGVGPNDTDLKAKYKVGSKVKARIICNFLTAKEPKLGISLLPHIMSLTRKRQDSTNEQRLPIEVMPISSFVEKCTVRHVEDNIGLFVDTGIAGLGGFVHISRVKDGKVEALYETSGPYKVGSVHRGRIVGYNEMDGLFSITFAKSILDQQYIRLEDIPIGSVINGEIEKLIIKEQGVTGLIVKVAEGITGFVPENHLSDIRLQNPEKKFRVGMKVKARVLSTNSLKRQMRLTLKKTLVNSEAPTIKSYDEVSIGMQTLGTIVKVQQNGAHVQFYGSLKGFLPVSEMSEAYIRDPMEHFRAGQVLSVHALEVDPEARRFIVSCKDPSAFGLEKQTALKNLKLGDIVSAKVTQKTEDQIFVELVGSQLKAILPVGHLTDKSTSKNQYAWKRISTGQTLSDLVVLEKNENRRAITLTQKPSLVKASQENSLLKSFNDAKVGAIVQGFVRNITVTAVFVQFAGSLNALLPRGRLPADVQAQPDFGMRKNESIEVKIVATIPELKRILVAPADAPLVIENDSNKSKSSKAPAPEDGLSFGSTAKVRITSVKDTQLNVQLVDSEIQGRLDVSQIFDKWEDILDPKDPLGKFSKTQILRVKIMGVHDAKDHRYLPFSHRSAHSVLELTSKPSDLSNEEPKPITFEDLKVGGNHIAFVNNVTSQYLWVNLSPNVRGRISIMEASDDLSLLNDLEANFPVGSAIKVRVTSVDAKNKRLDLSARSPNASEAITWASLKQNMTLPGKITKVNERQVLVKLSENVSGPVHLPDMVDDYGTVDTLKYKKGDIVRVSIVDVDASNKRIRLSMRPSRIMSSTLPVADKEISKFTQLSTGDIVRGFVKNVADKGVFVLLGGQVTGFVKISNLSDRFLKEWKDSFQIDQLVKGRVISLDAATNQLELSLKSSVVDEDYKPPVGYNDIKEGQIVTGVVRKVEEFGAFIVIDNSANVSGLCHRTQMADNAVKDATKLYKEGDKVKARVLEVDPTKRRISFGLKPSFFEDEDTDMESDAGAALDDEDEDEDDDGEGMELDEEALLKILGTDNQGDSSDDDEEEEEEAEEEAENDSDEEMEDATTKKTGGLGGGKKSAWSTNPFDDAGSESDNDSQAENADKKKKRKKKAEAQVDRTAELDAHGPQTSSDYERLLLGQPDSSELWIAYMAFQMQVSELPKAREVAERAIKSINIREETEKLNVWVAYLNLEVAYGSKHTVEDVFKRACQYNDEQEVYERLASIYIQSEKLKVRTSAFTITLRIYTNFYNRKRMSFSKPCSRSLAPRHPVSGPTTHTSCTSPRTSQPVPELCCRGPLSSLTVTTVRTWSAGSRPSSSDHPTESPSAVEPCLRVSSPLSPRRAISGTSCWILKSVLPAPVPIIPP